MKNTKNLFAMLILSGLFLVSCDGPVTTPTKGETSDTLVVVETEVVETEVDSTVLEFAIDTDTTVSAE